MNTANLPDILRALRDSLLTGLIERDTPIRLALLAALTGEHLLLIGPPGTAKSELARRLRHAFHDATYFERLLTRFSTPEELFGPLSIKALEQDRYERKTEHYLPEASVAFLDEIFKANSAILNALLTLLNEREFDNGKERKKTPLISVVAASNELPDGEELAALYDRFLLRYQVTPVSEDGFNQLLNLRAADDFEKHKPGDALKLRREDVLQIQSEADEVKALLVEFRKFLAEQKIAVSDRRWRKIVKLLQTSALTNGRQEISIWDCWLLQHCVWDNPEQQPAAREWYEKRVGASTATDQTRLTKLVLTREKMFSSDKERRTQRTDDKGNRLYEYDGKPVSENEVKKQGLGPRQKKNKEGELLFLGRSEKAKDRTNHGNGFTEQEIRNQFHYNEDYERRNFLNEKSNFLTEDPLRPALEPSRYPSQYIKSLCDQAQVDLTAIASHIAGLDQRTASLTTTVEKHLWISSDFVVTAKGSLEKGKAESAQLRTRMQSVLNGYNNLPVQTEESID